MLRLITLIVLMLPLAAQTRDTFPRTVSAYTVATLPTPAANSIAIVTDGASSSDCTTGGGSSRVLCGYTGSAWAALGGGGGGATTTNLYKRITFGSCDQTGGFNTSWVDNFAAGTATTTGCPAAALMAYRIWSHTVTNTHYVVMMLPDNWNSGAAIDMRFRSWMGSGSGNVRWEIATKCYGAGEDWTAVTGFNTAQQTSTLAYDGTNNTGTTTLNSVTTTGCAAGETMVFRIERDNAVGGNLAGNAHIGAVEIKYGITL
jgi:hypothetical protein